MVAISGPGWRLAPCLVALFNETDRRFPNRSKASDGSIGDPAHAARKSDHNPDNGWVDAGDLTDDKANGCDADHLAQHLVASRDERVSYIIWNRTIVKSYGPSAWQPQPYTGANPHDKHTHISVRDDARNDLRPWWPEEDDDMPLSDEDILKVAEAVTIALKPQLDAVYAKIVPTETVREDIRRTKDIAAKLGVPTPPAP